MQNCDNCEFYDVDTEDLPCSICNEFSNWVIANDLKSELYEEGNDK